MEGLIFSEDLCRLCLWRSSKLFPIFSLEGELQGIPLKIEMCLPISVTREDVLPKLICSQCIYKLEMFSEFRNSCVRSEQLLKRYTSHEPVQIPSSHTVVLQMQEEVKVEVQEPDPIAVEQEILFSVIPIDVHKEGMEEYGAATVQNRINREAAEVENRNVNATAIKKRIKRNRKVVKRKPTLKKQSNKPELLAARRDHTKHGRSRYTRSVADAPALNSSRQTMHRCKHCSKNFPSRVQLSRHLTSSNCLFQYTCRYCAKVFCNAKNRIHHERNHRGKKNFICRICKQKFQSSFDLNVHTLQGCKCSAFNSRQHSTVITETKMQKTQKKDTEGMNGKRRHSDGFLSNILDDKTKHFKCKYCRKNFTHFLSYKRHIRTCRRVMAMSKINDMRRKTHVKPAYKSVSLRLKQDNCPGNKKTKHKIPNVLTDDIDIKESSRRKEILSEKQRITPIENSLEKGPSDINLKASLLAVLGLKEKSKPTEIKTTQRSDEMKIGKTSIDIIEDEVVTVCDICRKIFTSESGMLNHQATAHNRNLTSEKINSLMRVEI